MRRYHGPYQVSGDPGRTIAELMVSLSIFIMVGLLLASAQGATSRWYKSDQRVSNVIRPVRDAVDYLARDVEIATAINYSAAEDGTFTRLILTQKRSGTEYTVEYWLENNGLQRSESEGAATATTRTVVQGLTAFHAETAGTGLVRLVLEAQSAETDSISRQLEMTLISRMEVAP